MILYKWWLITCYSKALNMILRTLFDAPGSSLYSINSLVIESRLPYLVQKQFHTNQEQWVLSIVPVESLLIVFLVHLSDWKLELPFIVIENREKEQIGH